MLYKIWSDSVLEGLEGELAIAKAACKSPSNFQYIFGLRPLFIFRFNKSNRNWHLLDKLIVGLACHIAIDNNCSSPTEHLFALEKYLISEQTNSSLFLCKASFEMSTGELPR